MELERKRKVNKAFEKFDQYMLNILDDVDVNIFLLVLSINNKFSVVKYNKYELEKFFEKYNVPTKYKCISDKAKYCKEKGLIYSIDKHI